MTSEYLNVAREFHETYERLAPVYGYETRIESAVPWEDVPGENRALMTATVKIVLGDLCAERDRYREALENIVSDGDPEAIWLYATAALDGEGQTIVGVHMTDTSTAIVRFTFEGFHRWPDASGVRAYLASDHRHLFHVCVKLETFHDEREVEFHDLLNIARRARGRTVPYRSTLSCEAMARLIGEQIGDTYPGRHLSVTVTEDGENGARIDFQPDPDDRSARVHD